MRVVITLLFAGAAFAQTLQPVTNPAAAGSIQPNWAVAADGSAILSWVEPVKSGGMALRYAVRKAGAWSEARTIVTGRKFWRHPAELPELVTLPDGTLLAHWVEKAKEASEGEDIYVSSSKDGMQWSAPLMAHKDHSDSQHGLASIVASGPKEASIFWLQALKGEDGPVSLMRTVVDATGKEVKEEELDKDVCSCCPTSVVKTPKGLLVAYRDHTAKDIRDIAVLRFENAKWSQSAILNADKWEINACPVNAAAAVAKDNRVGIAWYTEGGDMPRVQFISSSDGGTTFGKPVVVSGKDAQGYSAAALTDNGAVVSWIEEGEKSASVQARTVSAAGALGAPVKIAEGARMALGYPRLIRAGNETLITWGAAKTAVLK